MTVDQARRVHERLLDVHDAMHVLGLGVPVFYATWAARFAGDGAQEASTKRRWTRLTQWIRLAELPVRWVEERGPGYTWLGVVFTSECRALVARLLDENAARLADEARTRNANLARQRAQKRIAEASA